jgi:hypothetical protein
VTMRVRFPIVLSICLLFRAAATADDVKPCDSTVKFVDHNMVDYSVNVRAIRGAIIDSAGAPGYKGCVTLFASDRSTLLRSTVANDEGNFELKHVKPGSYWLIVQDGQRAFCPSSTHVKLRRYAHRSKLLVHLIPAGIDTCSYCEAK